MVTEPSAPAVRVLDSRLRLTALVNVPAGERRFRVSADDRHVVVSTGEELAVVDYRGQLLSRLPGEHGVAAPPECHLDCHGVLWVHRPPVDELVAVEAATGREIARAKLETANGEGVFVSDPTGVWTGLHVAMGYYSRSWLVRLESGRIALRPLDGESLIGLTPSGDRYFAMPRGFLTVRAVATDQVVAARHIDDVPGLEERTRLLEAAAVVSDELVIVAVNLDDFETDFEEHLLLSARSMRYRSTVEYPFPMTQNSIYPADGAGRWLTRSHEERVVRLWRIAGPLDDEAMPGQERLF
ncbi:hypothetical protein ACQP00_51060 [Dactylosporangium sp. CS-047395]|uniref:hypothetical protein n=1 Tax=Dactylosporangium sp. CS-047395 TaxID=3239936 RepID=UPI003D8D08AA